MVLFNYAIREITAKIVYYGPGLGGKTTNLQKIHESLDPKARGKLISLATDADRTLFFDFLPLDLGQIGGYRIRFQLYTVPGQVHYNATRKLVLKGVDAVVFVADSQIEMLERNRESYDNLKENLVENGYDQKNIPLVFQFNKQDLPNIASPEEVAASMGLDLEEATVFETVALQGRGVFETLKAIIKQTLNKLRNQFEEGQFGSTEKDRKKGRGQAAVVEKETHAVEPPPPAPEPVAVEEPAKPARKEMSEVDLETLLSEEIPEREPETEIRTPAGEVTPGAPLSPEPAGEIPAVEIAPPEEITAEAGTEVTAGEEAAAMFDEGPAESAVADAWEEIPMREATAVAAAAKEDLVPEESPAFSPPEEMEAIPPRLESVEDASLTEVDTTATAEGLVAGEGPFAESASEVELEGYGAALPADEPAVAAAAPETYAPAPALEAAAAPAAPEAGSALGPPESPPPEGSELAHIIRRLEALEKGQEEIKATLVENRNLMNKVVDLAVGRMFRAEEGQEGAPAESKPGFLARLFGGGRTRA